MPISRTFLASGGRLFSSSGSTEPMSFFSEDFSFPDLLPSSVGVNSF
jgi:hypothetical protein